MEAVNSSTYSKRDWIFIIIIISLLQGIIWYTSFIYSDNSSALGYVSFAGTLISIILAVLAIGYTYGESLGQKNKSDTLSNQIQILNEVIKNVKIETNELDKISGIKEDLEILSKTFDIGLSNTHKKVEEVQTYIHDFLAESENFKSSKETIENTIDKPLLSKLLLSARTPLMEISLLAIYAERNNSVFDSSLRYNSAAKYIESAKQDMKDDNKNRYNEGVEDIFVGSIISTLTLLTGASLVYDDERKLTFDGSLENEILNNVIPNPKSASPFYLLIREKIITKIKTTIN